MDNKKYTLICSECYSRNYKVKLSSSKRTEFKKYCPLCAKHIVHKVSL